MCYIHKSKENLEVAKDCLVRSYYNVGASRTYYSIFLKAKSYLINNNFDYEKFLLECNSKERVFSHGTIRGALNDCLKKKGKIAVCIVIQKNWTDLYKKRIIADYKDKSITKTELQNCVKHAEEIINMLL